MHKILFLFVMMLGIQAASGQSLWQKTGHNSSCPVCYGSGVTEKSFIPPPHGLPDSLKSAEKKSEFIVDYSLFPSRAKKAFDYAINIWESLIESPVPIYVEASWRPLSQNALGNCKPADFKKNFEGAPRRNIHYPIALAEKLSGKEITGPDRPDIIANFNSDVNWYFGTDGDTPGQLYDFVSVVLHEIAHGLGFFGFFLVEDNLGRYGVWNLGDATSYDQMVETGSRRQLINPTLYTNPSVALKNALVSGSLYANSPVAFIEGNFSRPRLFAPSPWDEGSSVYHLDDATYPANNINTLMTPAFGIAQAVHDPGPLAMGMLADMGWKTMRISFDPPKDREKISPVHFKVSITSDYPLNIAQLFLVFSDDSLASSTDSLLLVKNLEGTYEAILTPEPEIRQIQYYISAQDLKNRVFRKPSEAPLESYTIRFGPDTVKPVISHDPAPYLFDVGEEILLTARVDDNIAIDTVFVEYSINNTLQASFGLSPDPETGYSAPIPLESNLLNDGDTIRYRITAIDASQAQNTTVLPVTEYYTSWIEKMFDPVTGYTNNFENPSSDFVLFDFHVTTEEGFDNGALHSPHPYPSPDQDDTEYNFSTLLKYPVILTEGATMSFDEIVLIEPGETGTVYGDFEFWDYAIVEGSKDRGKIWLSITDGYDSGANAAWEEKYNGAMEGNNSNAVGSPELFVHRQVNILENGNFSAGDTILIRFRLFSDPYAHGWGWAIDNLSIQTPVSADQPVLSPGNILVYPNPFTGSFNVTVQPDNSINELQFDVYNSYGQKVKSILQENIAGTLNVEIALSNATSGMYLLVIREDGKPVSTRKLIRK
jgi:hypothetical protein